MIETQPSGRCGRQRLVLLHPNDHISPNAASTSMTRSWTGLRCNPAKPAASRWKMAVGRSFARLQAFVFLPFIPLGRYLQTSAWRDNVRGILKGPSAVFWNIEKT